MSLFLVGLAGLIALALVFVLPPLLRVARVPQERIASDAARRANLLVLREQLDALEAEHASGALNDEQYRSQRIEIERRALDEEQGPAAAPVVARSGKTAIALGAFVPLFAFVVYGIVGMPEAVLHRPPSEAAQADGVTAEQIEGMIAKLASRLENQTMAQAGDDQAWTMLARSYAVLQRFPEASKAFARARELAPENPQLMADHADVLAMLQGQRVAGEPAQLAQRALTIDPDNLKALALAGSAAFEDKDYTGALKHWTRASRLAEPGSPFSQGLAGSIAQARAAGGQEPAGASAPALAQAPAPAAPAAPAPAAAPGTARLTGVVQLAGALAAQAAPGDTVFVFARAAEGPRMPLAILKMRVSDLPLNFTLDDSTAMSPQMKLSNFPRVIVGARISRSGDAMPRTGDLVGQVGPVDNVSGKLVVTIDAVQP
jgi:cytochrome c-type biogenesis protein CcmH